MHSDHVAVRHTVNGPWRDRDAGDTDRANHGTLSVRHERIHARRRYGRVDPLQIHVPPDVGRIIKKAGTPNRHIRDADPDRLLPNDRSAESRLDQSGPPSIVAVQNVAGGRQLALGSRKFRRGGNPAFGRILVDSLGQILGKPGKKLFTR